jgi:hypothetical protein
MPNIDTDLFQVLTLALLFLALLSLLGALSILSGIKKRLESGDVGGSVTSDQSASTYDYGSTGATAYEPVGSYGGTTGYAAGSTTQTQEVKTDFVPIAEATPAAQPAATGAATTLRGDEPEEQPFERDGRWWFKRGGELLVYDEGTGQWVASGAGTAAPGAAGGVQTTSFQTPVATRSDAGEGWKCASCGAVNGSTATTCRMCFAPR